MTNKDKKQKEKNPEDDTMIPVKVRTRTRIGKNKIIDRESYDSVINRSLDKLEESKWTLMDIGLAGQ